MSGPYGPNDAPGTGEGRNDPTQQWGGGQPAPGGAVPGQQWGGQPQQPAPPTAQWGDPQQGQPAPGQQPWGQSQPQQPVQGQPQWGQSQPQWPQQGQPGQQDWNQSQPQPQVQPGAQTWGQSQPQWPQQGQPDWNQQTGQPGQQWPQPQQPGGKKKTGLIIGGVAVLLVVLGGIIAGVLFLTATDKLDNKAVATGVQKVLKDSYGIEDVQDVSCPSGQKVKVDATFECQLKVGGESKKVTIKVTKDDGTYEVGRPS
ncbi:DUF4333 domain-containing protein [Nocardia yamanashiensis]|uniref:DUF4333 domain-containing protein n=1 Tax=Nocardia yamanashiensis TaxID=209247 RepID=UPI001E5645D7|nr:DUF4333 domain-containing protein [Nocardia yamanashiensis]UGT44326.1 DUF4333 domain-containing protein [Nocardia yamanashiensis]